MHPIVLPPWHPNTGDGMAVMGGPNASFAGNRNALVVAKNKIRRRATIAVGPRSSCNPWRPPRASRRRGSSASVSFHSRNARLRWFRHRGREISLDRSRLDFLLLRRAPGLLHLSRGGLCHSFLTELLGGLRRHARPGARARNWKRFPVAGGSPPPWNAIPQSAIRRSLNFAHPGSSGRSLTAFLRSAAEQHRPGVKFNRPSGSNVKARWS